MGALAVCRRPLDLCKSSFCGTSQSRTKWRKRVGSKTAATKGEEVGGFSTERRHKKNKNRKEE
jgi:hypothetical protein